jgi:hypothetical protein
VRAVELSNSQVHNAGGIGSRRPDSAFNREIGAIQVCHVHHQSGRGWFRGIAAAAPITVDGLLRSRLCLLSQQQPKPGENLSVVAITVACSAFGSVGHLVYRGYVVQTLRAMLALLLGRRSETS